jgi:lipoic acid synthetase
MPKRDEPERIAAAVEDLKLAYVVITSVDRDDLDDFGASQFVRTVEAIKAKTPRTKVELLTPDFRADVQALDSIIACGADKLAHNEETVKRLSPTIRPQSDYRRSLEVLGYYADCFSGRVKSSLMVGLGEQEDELLETMQDLLNAGVSELTLGQYLQPTSKHHPVVHYYESQWFETMKEKAYQMGFLAVASGPLVRSSYHAESLGK